MDRLEGMAILLRVIDGGSFSAAGRALDMPLATVSRKVAELEAALGARLLIRTTRRLALTEAGAAYASAARTILAQVDEAERAAAGEFQDPRGELIVTAPLAFGRLHALPVIEAFLAAHPRIDVRLLLSDRNLQLVDEHVDMALRIGRLPDSALVATPLGDMRMVTCAAPAWIAAHGDPAKPQALAGLPCIAFDDRPTAPTWRFRDPATGQPSEITLRPRLTVTTADAAVQAAVNGVGATRVLHYQCAGALRAGTLRLLLAAWERPPAPVHLLHAPRARLPLKTRAFLDFATPHLRARLAALAASG